MSKIYTPGSVVGVDYTDFNGKKQTGLFLVLYDESLDSSVTFKNNIVCLKISSQIRQCSAYSSSLDDVSFLNKGSLVLCSKVHTFDKGQVFSTLGEVHYNVLKRVYRIYRRFITELERQVEDYF